MKVNFHHIFSHNISMSDATVNLKNLEQLANRRSDELKSIKVLTKQKMEETKKFIDLIGDNEISYENLQRALQTKLGDAENELLEARKRVRDLRLKKQQLQNEKNEAEHISSSTVESTEEISKIEKSIEQLSAEFSQKNEKVDEKRKELASKKEELIILR